MQHVLHLLLSKIGDDGNGEADDREHCANVRHPGESNGYWRRLSWGSRVEILGSTRRRYYNALRAITKEETASCLWPDCEVL